MYRHLILIILMLATMQLIFAQSIQDSYLAEARGDYPNALSHMQKLAKDDPNELFYTMRIAWLQYLLGSYQEAMNHYQTALAKLDHLDAHLGIINCQLALGQWDAALEKAEQLLPRHSDSSTLLGKAAYAAYMKKDYSRAAEFYTDIASLYPWDMDNRAYLVNNLYLSGAVTAAKKQYAILKKYAPISQTVIDYKGILDTP